MPFGFHAILRYDSRENFGFAEPLLSEKVSPARHIGWPPAPETARRARAPLGRCPSRTSARRARAARRSRRTFRRGPARHARRMMPTLGRLGRSRGLRGRRRRWPRSRRGFGGTFLRAPTAPRSRRAIAAPSRRSSACTTEIGSGVTGRYRAAATAGGSSTPTPTSCARRSRATRRSCGARTSSGTGRRARRTPSSPSDERTTSRARRRVCFANRGNRRLSSFFAKRTLRALRCGAPRTAASAGSGWRSDGCAPR